MFLEMARRLGMVLRDERGIETAEWIAILAIVLAIAFVVYTPGGLEAGLTTVVTNITTALGGLKF